MNTHIIKKKYTYLNNDGVLEQKEYDLLDYDCISKTEFDFKKLRSSLCINCKERDNDFCHCTL